MSDPEFLGLGDVPYDVADEAWFAAQRDPAQMNGSGPAHDEVPTEPVRIADLGEFSSVAEITADALLGSSDETILPADGILLMYGDGGAGKTTLTLDAVFHFAGARKWLGLEVEHALRVLVIENEGPRGKFRQILKAKSEAWNGDVASSIFVLEEPWSRFSLREPDHRSAIADAVNELQIDVVVLGPLATVGMVGGGTPDEISAFEALLRKLRARLERPVAFWIIHHENKAGDVSGAWERVPDTLVHVQGAGNGHTRFVIRKARWSSEYHGRTINLEWQDGRSFSVAEEVVRDLYVDVLEAFKADDQWRTSKETAKLTSIREGEARSVLAELTRRGDLVFEKGPHGRHATAQCYRLKGLRLVEDSDELEF